jgi:hypothetical protein
VGNKHIFVHENRILVTTFKNHSNLFGLFVGGEEKWFLSQWMSLAGGGYLYSKANIVQLTKQKSWTIFYMWWHHIFWWNTLSLNILEHSLQNVFFSKHRIKHFAVDEISAQVLFFSKVKNETFSRAMPTRRVGILIAADILPVAPHF